MKIGDVFYVYKDEYSARGSDIKYNEIVITAETPKTWECDRGTINKRSKKYREWERASPVQIYNRDEFELLEFDRKHRYKITKFIRRPSECPPEMLKKVATLIDYEDGE